jgi:hypothetical protein
MKVEFTFKSYSCLDAYIHWTVSGVDSIGRYMSFPSFLWSGGASLGRAFLSKTAKLRRRRLIFARRDPVALCFCLPVLFCFVFRFRAPHLHHSIFHACQTRCRSIVKVSRGECPCGPLKQTQANSNTLVIPFTRLLAGRPHPSACHPTIHTASCVEARQTAQNSPCNQRHQHTTPHFPGVTDFQLSDGALLLACIPALV